MSYPLERYLSVLKNYARTRARPEAAMAQGYMFDESLGFVTEYLDFYSHTRKRIWDSEEEAKNVGEVLEGKANSRELTAPEVTAIHVYVIENSVATAPMLRYLECIVLGIFSLFSS